MFFFFLLIYFDQYSCHVYLTSKGFFFYPLALRCGRLTHHISLPYSIIGQGHIEGAIKEAYCNRICGDCTHEVQSA